MLFLSGTAPFIYNLRAPRLIAIKGAFMAKLYAFVTGSQMDISKFTKDSPGRLVQINDGRDVTFILHPLPDSWKVPQDLVPIWVKARDILGWEPRVGFRELVHMMVEHDREVASREKALIQAGFVSGQPTLRAA